MLPLWVLFVEGGGGAEDPAVAWHRGHTMWLMGPSTAALNGIEGHPPVDHHPPGGVNVKIEPIVGHLATQVSDERLFSRQCQGRRQLLLLHRLRLLPRLQPLSCRLPWSNGKLRLSVDVW